jgi:hypothetical protein
MFCFLKKNKNFSYNNMPMRYIMGIKIKKGVIIIKYKWDKNCIEKHYYPKTKKRVYIYV